MNRYEQAQNKQANDEAALVSNMAADKRLTFKPGELVGVLGIGRNNVYALIHSGRLRSIRIGRKILIPRSAVEEFLASNAEVA